LIRFRHSIIDPEAIGILDVLIRRFARRIGRVAVI